MKNADIKDANLCVDLGTNFILVTRLIFLSLPNDFSSQGSFLEMPFCMEWR